MLLSPVTPDLRISLPVPFSLGGCHISETFRQDCTLDNTNVGHLKHFSGLDEWNKSVFVFLSLLSSSCSFCCICNSSPSHKRTVVSLENFTFLSSLGGKTVSKYFQMLSLIYFYFPQQSKSWNFCKINSVGSY